MTTLRPPFDAAPSSEAWRAIVSWLDHHRVVGGLEQALHAAHLHVAGWPDAIPRVCPLGWLRRLASGEQVPEVGLVNSLSLGNAPSLEPGGYDGFFTLDREELLAVLRAPFGRITRLSYSDDLGDHPLHTGFIVDTDDAHLFLGRRWPDVRWLRLSGWGLTETLVGWLDAAAGMASVRRLSLEEGGGYVDTDALPRILASPLLAQAERLDLLGYDGVLSPEQARQLIAAASLRGLRELHLGELGRECAAIFGALREHGVRLEVEVF